MEAYEAMREMQYVLIWMVAVYLTAIFLGLMVAWFAESRVLERWAEDVRQQIRAMGPAGFTFAVAITAGLTITAQKRTGDGTDTFGVRGPDPAFESGGNSPPPPRGGASGPARVVFQADLSAAFASGAPVCFTNEPDTLVRFIMIAAMADAPADLATLVDVTVPYSWETARIRAAPEGGPPPRMTAAEASLTGQFLSWAGQFEAGQWRVAEIAFDAPVPLHALHFGNSAGLAEWQRHWRGAIKGVVCFGAPPGTDVRAGVANFLALRGGFPGFPYKATPAQRQAAIDAGLNHGLAWSTIITVR